jgi:hypothetical protein
MSDETKIEAEDGEEVEAQTRVLQVKEIGAAEAEGDDDNDVEAHSKLVF